MDQLALNMTTLCMALTWRVLCRTALSASWRANLIISSSKHVRNQCGSKNVRLMLHVVFATLSFTYSWCRVGEIVSSK